MTPMYILWFLMKIVCDILNTNGGGGGYDAIQEEETAERVSKCYPLYYVHLTQQLIHKNILSIHMHNILYYIN